MTKNLSHELLTLKAVLLMRLIDKKESKEKMLERYLSCSDKVLKGYIEDFFEDEDEVVMDEDEETYTFASITLLITFKQHFITVLCQKQLKKCLGHLIYHIQT